MNVAHILRKYNPGEWGGTESALQRLFEGFQAHGVRSVVWAPRLGSDPAPSRDPFAELGCEIRRVGACVPVWGLSARERDQWISVGGNLMSFDLLPRLLREPGLDVIHTHALGRFGAMARVAAHARNLPLAVTIHGGVLDLPAALKSELQRPGRSGWEWGRLFGALLQSRKLLDQADVILTCNLREAELLRARNPARRVQVQPHGVRIADYQTPSRDAVGEAFPFLKHRRILLCLGRVDPVKNQEWLVRQTAPILSRSPQTALVLVGACTDADYGRRLDACLKELGLHASVFRLGPLPPGDRRLIGLLQAAEVLLLPSISETFGLVLLEAWAAGCNVLSSRTSGACGLVRDGENGFLFDLEQPECYRERLALLLAQPELRRRLAAAGLETCRRYDVAEVASGVKQLYEELAEARKKKGRASR